MNTLFKIDKDYSTWLKELKSKISSVQIKAGLMADLLSGKKNVNVAE